MITLELELEEVNFLLYALGELPTKSNAFNVATKIKMQGDAQVPQEPQENTVTTEATDSTASVIEVTPE